MKRSAVALACAAIGAVLAGSAYYIAMAAEGSGQGASFTTLVLFILGLSLICSAAFVAGLRKVPFHIKMVLAGTGLAVGVALVVLWFLRISDPMIGGFELLSIPLLGLAWTPLPEVIIDDTGVSSES